MHKTIEQQNNVLALKPADEGALLKALNLPDVSGISIEGMTPDKLATLAYTFTGLRAEATRRFNALCSRIDEMIADARQGVRSAINESGGAVLQHDFLDVKLESAGTEYDKRVDVLLELQDHLKPDEFAKAMMFKGVDLKDNPHAVQAALDAGAKPIYEPHAGQLNRLADEKHYGPNSEVGKIIERGLKKVEKGEPKLVIRPNESAIKAVS